MTQAAVLASNASLMTTPSGTAPSYLCRAWVNFNGTGVVAIRASGNVTSITDNGTGNYTVNFTTAMSDANYCAQVTAGDTAGAANNITDAISSVYTTTTLVVQTFTAQAAANTGRVAFDETFVCVSIFR